MDNIVNFPAQDVRDRVVFEREMKKKISTFPLDKNEQEELIHRCLAIWDKYQRNFPLKFSFPFPSSLSQSEIDAINLSLKESISEFKKIFQDHMYVIFVDRLNTEFKLFHNEISR